MNKYKIHNPPDADRELRQARKATRYAAMTEAERREQVWTHAWHCVCLAQGRKMVRAGYGKHEYTGEKASQQHA